MSKSIRNLFFLLGSLPFITMWPYSPYVTIVNDALAVILSLAIAGLVFYQTRSSNELKISFLSLAFLFTILLILLSVLIVPHAYLTVPIVAATYFFASALLAISVAKCNLLDIDALTPLLRGIYFCSWVQIVFVALQKTGGIQAYNQLVADTSLLIPRFPLAPDATGLIFQANQLADFLFLALLATCFLRIEKEISGPVFISWILAAGTSCALTSSRSSLVFAATLTIVSIWMWLRTQSADLKEISKLTIIASVSFVLIQFVTKLVSPLFTKSLVLTGIDEMAGRSFLGERLDLWKKGYLIFAENPIFGAGWGSYGAEAVKLQGIVAVSPDGDQFHSHAHNIVIHLLAEAGIFTTSLIIGTLLFVGYKLWRGTFTTKRFVAFGCFLVIGLHSLVEYPLWSACFIFPLVILLSSEETSWRTINIPGKLVTNLVIIVCFLVSLGSLLAVKWNLILVSVNFDPVNKPLTRYQTDELRNVSQQPLLAEMADFFLLLKVVGVSDSNLQEKLTITEKLMQRRPNTFVLFNRAIFLSYAGREDEAAQLIKVAHLNQSSALREMVMYFNQLPADPRLIKVRDQLVALSKI